MTVCLLAVSSQDYAALAMSFPSKAVVLVVAIAVVGAAAWVIQPTRFISDDSYFYLVVARNVALHGHQTFSNVTDTNGFQPLWGYTLILYSFVVGQIHANWLWNRHYALPLSIGVLATAVWVWLRLSSRFRLNPALVAGVPVAFVCCFGVLYSEASVELLLIGLLALRFTSPSDESSRWWAITGLLAGLTVLARIDMVFLAIAAIGVLIFQHRPAVRQAAICVSAGMVPLCAYLISNQVSFGYPIPMSGFLKSSFPDINVRPIAGSGLQRSISGINLTFGLVPLVFTAIALLFLWHHRVRPLLVAMFIGASGQAVEVGLFGRGGTSWYWYYVLSVAMAGIAAGGLVERLPEAIDRAAPYAVGFIAIGALLLGIEAHTLSQYEAAGIRIVQSLRLNEHQTLIVSDSPGRMAFETRTNIFAADMLTANYRFYGQMKASPNALQFVIDQARDARVPVRALLVYSEDPTGFLRTNQTYTTVVYPDPAKYPDGATIGRLDLGKPSEVDDDVALWILPSS